MPPSLTLFGCYVLALWVYLRERRTHPYPTAAIWLPTLWMMRCASRTFDAWFDGGGDSGRIDPILIAFMIVAAALVLSQRRCQWGQVFAMNSAVFLFYAYLSVSVIWTEGVDNPAIKILRPLGDLFMALIVATEVRPAEAIMTVFRRTATFLVPMSIVLIRYFPYLGKIEDKHWGADIWVGVSTHKNPLGQLCMVSALAFVWSLVQARRRGQKWYTQFVTWLYLAMTAYLFNGGGNSNSRSSTSILCLGLAVGMYFYLGRLQSKIQALVQRLATAAVLLLVASGVLMVAGTSLQAVVAGAFGKDATLSDRTYLWEDVLRIGSENAILGSGYGGFWTPAIYPRLSPAVDNRPAEAHNGYLETFANLGLVGVALLAFIIFQAVRTSLDTIWADFEYGKLRLALLFMVLVMNYSEATFPRGTHLWWFGFLLVALYARPAMTYPGDELAGAATEPFELEADAVAEPATAGQNWQSAATRNP